MYSITDLAPMNGVSASTLTRLAQRLGDPGFSAFQERFRRAVMEPGDSCTRRAGLLLTRGGEPAPSFAQQVVRGELANLEELAEGLDADAVERAASVLIEADRVLVPGLRQSFTLANGLAYVLGMMRDDVRLLGEAGHRLVEDLSHIREGDALVAISFRPYTRETVLGARLARRQGAALIGLSDCADSPVLTGADPAFAVPAFGPFPFNALAAASVLAEAILAVVAHDLGERATAVLERQESLFDAFRIELRGPERSLSRPQQAEGD